MKKTELPETLGWYRDSARWILGLSLGGLSGFIGLGGFSERLSTSGGFLKGIFLFAGLVVLAAVICGVLFNLFLAQFGNELENEHDLKEDKAISEEDREKESAEIEERKESAKGGYEWTYWGLLIFFVLSMLCFAVVGGWLVLTPTQKAETPITWAAIFNESIPKEPKEPTVQSVNLSELQNKLESIDASLNAIRNELPDICCRQTDQPTNVGEGGCKCPNAEPKCAHSKSAIKRKRQ